MTTNPFLRPRTTADWLRGSLCWTGSCLGAWWLGGTLLSQALPRVEDDLFLGLMLAISGLAHGLIWWRAVAGGRAIIRHDEQHCAFSWTRLAANLWLVALTMFQVVCLAAPCCWALWALSDTPPAQSPMPAEPFFG